VTDLYHLYIIKSALRWLRWQHHKVWISTNYFYVLLPIIYLGPFIFVLVCYVIKYTVRIQTLRLLLRLCCCCSCDVCMVWWRHLSMTSPRTQRSVVVYWSI